MLSHRDIFLLIISFIVIMGVFISFIVLSLVRYKKTQGEHAEEKQALKTIFQQELLKTQLEIQEQTLKNISEEIHDNIGQVLSLVKLNINTMDIQKPLQLEEKIQDSKSLVSKAIIDLRNLSRSINTDYIREIGLLSGIQYELSLLKKTVQYDTIVETDGVIYRMESQKELILFRIFQEAINNIIKHADCSQIAVQLSFQTGCFIMCIRDNGKGFVANYSYSGIGLANMKNRATLMGGEFILSTSNAGTEVKVVLPIDADRSGPNSSLTGF